MKSQNDHFVRRYKAYSKELLAKVVNEIKSKKITLSKASKKYDISKGTLSNKLNQKHTRKCGRNFVLSEREAMCIVKNMIVVSDWGFPFDKADLCRLVKLYLDKCGRNVLQFKNNLPTRQWALRFVTRNKDKLTERLCQNLKRSKANLTEEMFAEYFDNLLKTLTLEDGTIIPPERVYNYDETNLSDDPGAKKFIFRRGVKYPERVKDSSKASTSLMFCGSASGQMLPPYVVYKAKHMYPTWMEGGPDNTRYNRSKSGWFDATTFADWFESLFIPHIRKMKFNGKVVLIGDNLSSHFSEKVITLCHENKIDFVCVPRNSTHLAQPLDVAFYAPLKGCWRIILNRWKSKKRKSQTVTKEKFPELLKELCEKVQKQGVSTNLISGFRKCGISPFDPKQVIERLPKKLSNTDDVDAPGLVSEAVADLLKHLRHGSPEPQQQQPKPKRSKLNIEPGKSISFEEIGIPMPTTISTYTSNTPEQQHQPDTEMEDKCDENCSEDESSSEEVPDSEEIVQDEAAGLVSIPKVSVSDYVLIEFALPKGNFQYYVAKVTSIDANDDFYNVMFLRNKNYKFVWPDVEDVSIVLPTQVRKVLSPPLQTRSGLVFEKEELLKFRIQ